MGDTNGTNNFNLLKEMLLDERKLVTYVSLSKELCIHVNKSKILLTNALNELRKTSTNLCLNATYIISGLLGNNIAQTVVCGETELSDLQTKFKTVFFQHIYSVNVGSLSVDNASFMAVNKFEDFPLSMGLIKSNQCERRPAEEILRLKTKSQDTVTEKISNTALQDKVKEECSNEKMNEGSNTKIQHTTKSIIKTKLLSPKKLLSNDNSLKGDSKNVIKNRKGIAGFFNSGSNSSNKKSLNGIQEKTIVKSQEEEIIRKPVKMDIDEEAYKTHIAKDDSSTSKLKSNEILDKIKKTAKVDKKRKRVLQVVDSESEDENNDPFVEVPSIQPESDDEIPPTPLVNTVKITSGIVNPKKKRKIVDKTYTGEDGYILTKKEEVYVSSSENEEEINAKENIGNVKVVPSKTSNTPPKDKKEYGNKNNKKKLNSPQKGKQATLMNFFKKI